MKPHLLIFLVTFLVSDVYCQIVYDFPNGRFVDDKVLPVKHGQFVYLKIRDINTFRYKVQITGKNIEYVTPIPSELQTVFRLQSTSGAATAAASASSEAEAETASAISKMEALEGATPSGNLKTTLQELITACNDYLTSLRDVSSIKFHRMILIGLSKQHWRNHSELAANLPVALDREQMRQQFIDFSAAYERVKRLYEVADTQAGSPADKALVQSALKQVIDGYEKAEDDDFLKLIEDVTVLQGALANSRHFEVNAAPTQMDGDFVALNVKIEPTPTNSLMPFDFAREIPMEIPCQGGWKADFSVGPTFSFGSGSRDEDYLLQPVTTDSSLVTIQNITNSSTTRPGLAAMIHAYPRTGKGWAVGAMMGVGAGFQSANDADISYYLGGSVVLGKRQKIMFSAGWSFIPVDRLKSPYNVNDTEYPSADIEVSDLTDKTIRASGFISISYNLTNRVEIK